MPKPRTVAFLISISVTFLVMQFYAVKFLYARLNPPKPLEERPPWEAVKLFLEKCETSGLPVFVIEPSLLRAVRDGSRKRVDLWNRDHQESVAFGVIDPGLDQMHLVMSAMKHENYDYWEKNDPDLRGITAMSRKSYRSVTTHFILWVPVESHRPMLIHLVVFYKRGNYLWHSGVEDKLHPPPFDLEDAFTQKTGAYNTETALGNATKHIWASYVCIRYPIVTANWLIFCLQKWLKKLPQETNGFNLATVHIEGARIQFPNDSYAFLREMERSEFIECNYTRAYQFYSTYHMDKSKEVELFKRKARQLLLKAKDVLDNMGIPFWLSSGTCLGWFRQCDLISHTTDVDIGIFIKDYREEMVSLLENAGLVLTHRFGKVSDSLELSFLYGDLKLDIFFFYKTEKYIWNGGTQASTGNKYKYIFPHFDLCWTEFLELRIRVPCPPEPYILANYGPKWMVPDHSWDWKASPNNVMANGKWPEKEWDDVIQLYE